MSSQLGKWMKGAFEKRHDEATAADWESMNQLLDAHPAFAAKAPWYASTTLWVVGAVVSVVSIGGWFIFDSSSSSPDQPVMIQPPVEEISNSIRSESPINPSESVAFEAESNDVSVITRRQNEGVDENTHQQTNESDLDLVEPMSVELASDQPALSTGGTHTSLAEDVDPVVAETPSNPSRLDAAETVEVASELGQASAEPLTSLQNEASGSSAVQTEAGISESIQSNTYNESANVATVPSRNGEPAARNNSSENTASPAVTASESSEASEMASSVEGVEESASASNRTMANAESAAAPEIIRRSPAAQEWTWSAGAYGVYESLVAQPSAEGQPVATSSPLYGFGLEVEAQKNGWTVASGLDLRTIDFEMDRSTSRTSQVIQYSEWAEFDTITVPVIDSIWVITGINTGYWRRDTTYEEQYLDVVREQYDTNTVTTTVDRQMVVSGYRFALPLLVGYTQDIGRWSLGVQAGPVVTLHSVSVARNEEVQSFSTWGMDLTARLEVGYKVHSDWRVFVRGGIRTNATSSFTHNAAAFSRWNTPMMVGLRYRF